MCFQSKYGVEGYYNRRSPRLAEALSTEHFLLNRGTVKEPASREHKGANPLKAL